MRMVYIMVGANGSGKTTWIEQNEGESVPVDIKCQATIPVQVLSSVHNRWFVCGINHFFTHISFGYNYDKSQLPYAIRLCMAQFVEALAYEDIEAIYVDNPNLQINQLTWYIQTAQLAGIPYTLVLINQTDIHHLKENNIHNIPEGVLLSQISAYQSARSVIKKNMWNYVEIG